ncbi:MAG: sugar phosphate isomerase/epimerase [Spirochaetes bacterium]|nr:sugar phosphate isomerase/epimerase [Spirochaetota bacterium]
MEYQKEFIRGKKEHERAALKKRIILLRSAHKTHLDIASRMLERLCRSFPDTDFCFETRLHYHEIPTLDEAAYLFDRITLKNLFYWHDIGHTYAQDRLGFARQTEWQRRFGGRCRGIHVHDARMDLTDHLPPGIGTLDFDRILSEFEETLPYTLEIHPRFAPREVISGIEHLKKSMASLAAARRDGDVNRRRDSG